jgi:nitric oxide dioxygenase
MTPQQVNEVQASFAKVIPIAVRAAALFYGRLFEMAPETRALFHSAMDRQGRKLMSTLTTIVNGRGDFDALVTVVRDLANSPVGRERQSFAGGVAIRDGK